MLIVCCNSVRPRICTPPPGRHAGSAWNRSAFTLVELLAVIAIIGVLVGLLLPAVQTAREAARRSACSSKLRQIGLGLANYHSANKRFPPGALQDTTTCAPAATTPRRGSWTVWILPFIEQVSLYDAFDPANSNTRFASLLLPSSAAEGTSTNITGQNTPLPIFKCPSDMAHQPNDPSLNYLGVQGGGAEGDRACATGSSSNRRLRFDNGGLFTVGSKAAAVDAAKITDGLSKTFLVGESRWWSYAATNVGYANYFGWSSSNRLATSDQPLVLAAAVDPLNNPLVDYDASQPWVDANGGYTNGLWLGTHSRCFGSRHPGGCHMAMADGSVVFLNDTIETTLYRSLGTRADGLPVGGFQ
jgi:prepilin-type N-terminal cleavage/methylation domain-containing protein/prepilin-type processing-associated H-X9-DG protein